MLLCVIIIGFIIYSCFTFVIEWKDIQMDMLKHTIDTQTQTIHVMKKTNDMLAKKLDTLKEYYEDQCKDCKYYHYHDHDAYHYQRYEQDTTPPYQS